MKVLYIEDNDINRFVFTKMLDGIANIYVASNGEEGLNLLDSNKFEYIFLDLNLGDEMDGFEILKFIESSGYRKNNNPKIIAITAYVSDEWEEKCKSEGFDSYISKPVTPKNLRDIITQNSLN